MNETFVFEARQNTGDDWGVWEVIGNKWYSDPRLKREQAETLAKALTKIYSEN